jgi:hypothetical protein
MVGTTRSRVGYFLKQFRENGFVEVTDHSLILEPKKLRAFVAKADSTGTERQKAASETVEPISA